MHRNRIRQGFSISSACHGSLPSLGVNQVRNPSALVSLHVLSREQKGLGQDTTSHRAPGQKRLCGRDQQGVNALTLTGHHAAQVLLLDACFGPVTMGLGSAGPSQNTDTDKALRPCLQQLSLQ